MADIESDHHPASPIASVQRQRVQVLVHRCTPSTRSRQQNDVGHHNSPGRIDKHKDPATPWYDLIHDSARESPKLAGRHRKSLHSRKLFHPQCNLHPGSPQMLDHIPQRMLLAERSPPPSRLTRNQCQHRQVSPLLEGIENVLHMNGSLHRKMKRADSISAIQSAVPKSNSFCHRSYHERTSQHPVR